MRRSHIQMKQKMLTNLLIGCLFAMIALGNSSARLIKGQKGIGNELYVTGVTSMFAQKGTLDPTRAAHMRKLGLGGKKLMAHEEASMESKNEERARGGGTSKPSGEEKDALKESIRRLKEQKNEQKKHMTMIAPKALKFTNFVIPRSSLSNTNSKCPKDSSPVPVKASLKSSSRPERQISQESQSTTQTYETQNLLEAEKDVMNLIHKDYKGTARRRSPINNQEPKN